MYVEIWSVVYTFNYYVTHIFPVTYENGLNVIGTQEEELDFNERKLQCVTLLKQLRVQYPHLNSQV